VSTNGTDAEAIAASISEPGEFGVIFERHFRAILRYLRRRLDDGPAEEATAQTFFVAFDERGRFDPERDDARPWLFGIATNVARRHRRSEVRELRAIAALDAAPATADVGSERRLDAEALRGPLAACLAELPAEESDVLYLLVWAELDQPEIAAALEIPLGTVKSRLSRARKRLRDALDLPDPSPADRPDPDPTPTTNTGGTR
jgi:RNA polymerase sigma factor (sigma-70 family)